MLYTSPLFFSSQGQIIHLRLDLIYSSFFILVEMEKHANLLLSLSHGLASVLRDLHSHEAIRTRAINSAWKIQLCSARLCLQLLRKKKKKKEKLPGEGKCIFGLWARILATRIQPLNCRRVDNSGIVRDDCFQLWELHSETFEVYIRGHSMGASGWVKTQVSNELWSPTLCLHWGGRAPAPITLMQRLTASTHRAVLVTNAKSRFCFTET